MKVTKIPGLGRFGAYIDDVNFNTLTDEEWQEIGRIHLDTLVTIIRNVNVDPIVYERWMRKWGAPRDLKEYRLTKKYKQWVSKLIVASRLENPSIDPEDLEFLRMMDNMLLKNGDNLTSLLKITGKRNEKGEPLGMFAEGELLWHSNESGNLCFAPQVSLLGQEGVVGSATGFVTTADWYEKQTESFRSELNDMIMVHNFTPGKINPGLRDNQDRIMNNNMCPTNGIEIPLVMRSPGGHVGLHYSIHTISHVKGMSVEESQKLFDRINKELFTDEYVYDHWYQQNGDLCLFDNSITLHRRLGGITNRMGYRYQYAFESVVTEPYMPYLQEPYISEYKTQIRDIVSTLGIKNYKIPE